MTRQMWMAGLSVLLVGAGSAYAQTPTRTAADVITVLGCVEREADYRAQTAEGKGGAAGTGIGVGNEFILRSARTASNKDLKPIGTKGSDGETIYSVTGSLEHEMTRAVGQEVAVSGFVEVAATDGTNKVKDLPRLNAVGWHVVSQSCQTAPSRK